MVEKKTEKELAEAEAAGEMIEQIDVDMLEDTVEYNETAGSQAIQLSSGRRKVAEELVLEQVEKAGFAAENVLFSSDDDLLLAQLRSIGICKKVTHGTGMKT